MSLFKEVKAAVTTRQAAEHYGFHVSRNGMMCCPFHKDRSPSMKVDQNFICFGCQEKGDVVRFAAKLFNLTPKDAATKLAADFGLNISDHEYGKSAQKRSEYPEPGWVKMKLLEQRADRIYRVYCDYLHLLNDWKERYAPQSMDEDWHPLFVEACQQSAYVNYLLDCLFDGTPEDKAAIITEKEKEVKTLERRIAEFKIGEYAASDGRTDPGRRSERNAGSLGQGLHLKQPDELYPDLSA